MAPRLDSPIFAGGVILNCWGNLVFQDFGEIVLCHMLHFSSSLYIFFSRGPECMLRIVTMELLGR